MHFIAKYLFFSGLAPSILKFVLEQKFKKCIPALSHNLHKNCANTSGSVMGDRKKTENYAQSAKQYISLYVSLFLSGAAAKPDCAQNWFTGGLCDTVNVSQIL